MATWQQVRERLRAQFDLDTDSDQEVAFTIERTTEGRGRLQRVILHRYQAWGRDLVEIRSAFGEAGVLDPAGALADNLLLPIGAIAQHGKFLVLVHKSPLDDLQPDTVVFLAARIAALADALEERRGTDQF